jgi:transcription antitermination factor NusB
VTKDDAERLAVRLAEALAGPDALLRELLDDGAGSGYGTLREAADLLESAAADPVGFAAEHGDPLWNSLRLDAGARDRLHRVFRRDDALEALYAADQSHRDPDTGGCSDQAAELAERVWEARVALDERIDATSDAWRVKRMAPVDRNVIRLGLWELQQRPETPTAVILSEAVRLAKAYSTEHSGRFVNGVLAALAASERGGESE